MATVIRGDRGRAARLAARDPAALVMLVGGATEAADPPLATIAVSVKDAALERRLARAMTRSLRSAVATPREIPVVRARSRKAIERLGSRISGAIVIVAVTAKNQRRLGEVVEALRDAGAAGVQLVWDGRDPPRAVAEARIFAVLEAARATPGKAPVVLSRGDEPAEALRILIDARR